MIKCYFKGNILFSTSNMLGCQFLFFRVHKRISHTIKIVPLEVLSDLGRDPNVDLLFLIHYYNVRRR